MISKMSVLFDILLLTRLLILYFPNSIVDACTVNAFKARLDKFWQHQLVKFDFTADLTGIGNRSKVVIK